MKLVVQEMLRLGIGKISVYRPYVQSCMCVYFILFNVVII